MVQMVLPKILESPLLKNININKPNIDQQVKRILDTNQVAPENIEKWLLKAISVIDLTTLAGDDTRSNVTKLCIQAANPLNTNTERQDNFTTAAVCVYPNRVSDAYEVIKLMKLTKEIKIASVATGFPSGLYPISSRIEEITKACHDGADEIDVVLDRSLVLMGKWEQVYEEVSKMRKACGNTHLKVILGVGELGSYENVYKASIISMLAGADFIKTSTGKETVNATLPIGLVMCRAIRNYYMATDRKVGLKPAGGIKTAQDAISWLVLVQNELGPDWLSPQLFRIGASSLLKVIVAELKNIKNK